MLDVVDDKLNLNRTKLPAPETSDYVTPSAACASTMGMEAIDDFETAPLPWTDLEQNSEYKESGNYSGYLSIINGGTATKNDTIDLTDIDELRLWMRWKLDCYGTAHVYVQIATLGDFTDAITLWETSVNDGAKEGESVYELDVSGYSGLYYFRVHATTGNRITQYVYIDNLADKATTLGPDRTIDNELTSKWQPDPVNESGAWCRWGMGALKICSGCRIYWGADAAYRPTAYRIEVSVDGEAWTTVKTLTEAPAAGWVEYSWNSRYARYIRLIVDTHGATGTEIFEADYYSRITERVAAEHGHGSGVTPHLKGHGVRKGFTVRDALKAKPVLTPKEIVDYIDFMLGE